MERLLQRPAIDLEEPDVRSQAELPERLAGLRIPPQPPDRTVD